MTIPNLPSTQRRILDFILANPGCSKRQIDIAVYGRSLSNSRVVQQHIYYISRALAGSDLALLRGGRQRSRLYYIVPARQTTLLKESPCNGNV